MFFGAVSTGVSNEKGRAVEDFETKEFHSLQEASRYAFPSTEAATACLLAFPETKNLEYEIVAAESN